MDRRSFIEAAAALSVGILAPRVRASPHPVRASSAAFEITEKSITQLSAAMGMGALSCETLTQGYLHRIERYDRGSGYHAVLTLNPQALVDARERDAQRRAGKLFGPLHGIPVLVKDNIETADSMPTTAGSLALARSMRRRDAPLVARLRAQGAVILGKTNLSEWANFRSTGASSGWSALGGQVRNAYALLRNPSGSSSGSAVAAALSFAAAAIGTETNGSILSPAAVNGVVGFKPTVGLVSGQHVVPISPRQDTAGPLCRSAADAALMAASMSERPQLFSAQSLALDGFRLTGVRIGTMPLPANAHPHMQRRYADVLDALRQEGAELIDVALPESLARLDDAETEALLYEFKDAINAYLATLDPTQVATRTLAELIAFNDTHAEEELTLFGQELFTRAQMRGASSDAPYRAALVELKRNADTDGLAALFGTQRLQLLIGPGNGPAALIDHVWGDRGGGISTPIGGAAAIAGYPSLSMPAGLIEGLPAGMTLVAPRNADPLLLQTAHAYERASQARVPPKL